MTITKIFEEISVFKKLIKHFDKKYLAGKGIRWVITDADGKNVSCNCCGNMANGVIQISKLGSLFNIPYCRNHISEIMDADQPDHTGFTLPSIIKVKNASIVIDKYL